MKMTNVLSLLTAIIRTDSYKLSQFLQYPPDTTRISSYIESRGGEKESVFFGLQAFIKQYMLTPITQKDINMAEKLVLAHGLPFNREGWEIIVNEYDGMLPLEIEAVPEGTVMETRNVQVQVVNTDPRLFWLTSYIETAMLRGIWYPSTVATKSRKLKKIIAAGLHKTSDIPVNDQIQFKLHDFGARGASSSESAMLGGMAHLTNFMGTDTVEALVGAMEYYNSEVVPGFSIPASEHSTICGWGGPEGEVVAFENMIVKFAGEGKIYACVSDSYDIYAACRELWGGVLKDKVISSGGTLVVRPDSGDPMTVPIEVLNILAEKFGFAVNSKGYKVLPSYIRVIQGDGLNEETLPILIKNVIDAGFSLDNIAFGMGGGLLQAWNRDTLKYAMKASAREDTNGIWHNVFKDPISDKGKTSKKGLLGLVYDCGVGSCSYKTVPKNVATEKGNLLRTVYRNGALLIEDTFDEVRARAGLKVEEYSPQIIERY
jgi:nicotinamide phosphoribosyltransferase